MPALFQPSPILQAQRPSVRLSTLEYGRSQRSPLSLPTLRRPTPIATTALTFRIGVTADGDLKMRLAG